MATLYEIPNREICYGVAYMAAQAALRNDFENFLQRLKDIQTGKNENIIKSTLFKKIMISL